MRILILILCAAVVWLGIFWHKKTKTKAVIFFITGTSSAGKSTLVTLLKKELPFIMVYDFDEEGVPDGADEDWRKKKTDEWLQRAQRHQQEKKSTIVCGVCLPAEIKQAPHFNTSLNVHYGLIHIDDDEIKRRLESRGWSKKNIEDNVNWAKHLEMAVKAEPEHFIVDGQINTPEQVAQKFIEWIKKEILI